MMTRLILITILFTATTATSFAGYKVKVVDEVDEAVNGTDADGQDLFKGMAEHYKGQDSLWFQLDGISPESTDAAKQEKIESWDEQLKHLLEFVSSDMPRVIGFEVGEAVFLKSAEGYSNSDDGKPTWNGKGLKLNIKRFVIRYKPIFDKLFANKKGVIFLGLRGW